MIKTKLKQLINKSFVTNQDLLQQLKNRSTAFQKQNTHRLHSQQSKINLIKKKSFQRLHTQQENSSFVGNISNNHSFIIPSSDKAVCLLQDIITQLGNNKLCHKLKKVLAYIRQMLGEQKKAEKQQKEQKQQLEQYYLRKIDLEREQQQKLKKINEQAVAKLNQYRQKILSIRKQTSLGKDAKQPSGLQQIILNQSLIIDQQCDEYYHQSNQMKRLLKTQALQIEQFLKTKHKQTQKQDSYIKQYNSLGTSFLLKH